jgi:hypothetical protein
MPKIEKERFDKLYDENISRKEYNLILAEVEERVGELMEKVLIWNDDTWWIYDNGSFDEDNKPGFFDPYRYHEDIDITGEFHFIDCMKGSEGIPTKWIWTSDEDIDKEINKANKKILKEKEKKRQSKELSKQKEAEKLQKYPILWKSILTKIGDQEEFDLIKDLVKSVSQKRFAEMKKMTK